MQAVWKASCFFFPCSYSRIWTSSKSLCNGLHFQEVVLVRGTVQGYYLHLPWGVKKNMDFGGCCDMHFLFLQNPILAFDGHSDWYTRLFCINTEDAILFLLNILFNLVTSAQTVSRWLLRGHYLKFMWIMDNVHFKQKVGEGVVPLQYLFCEVC